MQFHYEDMNTTSVAVLDDMSLSYHIEMCSLFHNNPLPSGSIIPQQPPPSSGSKACIFPHYLALYSTGLSVGLQCYTMT